MNGDNTIYIDEMCEPERKTNPPPPYHEHTEAASTVFIKPG